MVEEMGRRERNKKRTRDDEEAKRKFRSAAAGRGSGATLQPVSRTRRCRFAMGPVTLKSTREALMNSLWG